MLCFRGGFSSSVCFHAAVHQHAAGELHAEGKAAGDGAAAQPEQSGAGAAPTGVCVCDGEGLEQAEAAPPTSFSQNMSAYLSSE